MITKLDLEKAIAECEGERNPNANTCIKLAAFFTIKKTLYPDESDTDDETLRGYSFSQSPYQTRTDRNETIGFYGDSDFLSKINGMPLENVMPVIDELMETLSVINPRLYDGVMRKLQEI